MKEMLAGFTIVLALGLIHPLLAVAAIVILVPMTIFFPDVIFGKDELFEEDK